jgi:hypothetical protein
MARRADDSLDQLSAAIDSVRGSEHIKVILAAVLGVGNLLNGGTNGASAYGFKMSSLGKLSGVKGTNGRTNLLQFLAVRLGRDHPARESILSWKSVLRKAAKVETVSRLLYTLFYAWLCASHLPFIHQAFVEAEVKSVSRSLRHLQSLIESDTKLRKKLGYLLCFVLYPYCVTPFTVVSNLRLLDQAASWRCRRR